MPIENELDYDDMAQVHHAMARWTDIRSLVIAGRKAFDTFSLPEEEQRALDEALEKFAEVVTYEEQPCMYCSSSVYSGLPGGSCENCMGTGVNHGN